MARINTSDLIIQATAVADRVNFTRKDPAVIKAWKEASRPSPGRRFRHRGRFETSRRRDELATRRLHAARADVEPRLR